MNPEYPLVPLPILGPKIMSNVQNIAQTVIEGIHSTYRSWSELWPKRSPKNGRGRQIWYLMAHILVKYQYCSMRPTLYKNSSRLRTPSIISFKMQIFKGPRNVGYKVGINEKYKTIWPCLLLGIMFGPITQQFFANFQLKGIFVLKRQGSISGASTTKVLC